MPVSALAEAEAFYQKALVLTPAISDGCASWVKSTCTGATTLPRSESCKKRSQLPALTPSTRLR